MNAQTVPPSRASSQEKYSVVWLRPRSHLTITTWRELAWVGWGGQTVENLAPVGRKFELDQIQANSSQVSGQTITSSIEVVNLARVGLSWEDRLARALGSQQPVRLRASSAPPTNPQWLYDTRDFCKTFWRSLATLRCSAVLFSSLFPQNWQSSHHTEYTVEPRYPG